MIHVCLKSKAPVYRETSEPGSDVIILIRSVKTFDSYEGALEPLKERTCE